MISGPRRFAIAVALAGVLVLLTGRGDPSVASPDVWGVLRALSLVPAWIVVGLAPGWLLTGAGTAPWSFERVGFAVLLSVLVAFSLGVLLLAFHLPLSFGARGLAALAIVGGGLAALPVRRGRSDSVREAIGSARAAAWLLAGWLVLLAAIYVANPNLRPRVDGWFHAAVAAHLAQTGLPLEDPWFAGHRLLYSWAYHVLLDVTVAASPAGTTPLDALVGWSLLAALATGALVIALARAWALAGTGPGDVPESSARRAGAAGAWALAFAILATNPAGVLFTVLRGFVGVDRGFDHLAHPFDSGASSTLSLLTFQYPHVSLAFFGDKFLTPTAFGLGYACVLAAARSLFFPRALPGFSPVVLAAVAIAVALFVHTLTGLALLLALGAWLVLRLVFDRRRAADAAGAAGAAGIRGTALAMAVAFVFALPYLVSVMRGRQGGASPHFSFAPEMLWAILATGVLYFLFASRPVVQSLGRSGGPRELSITALVFLAAALSTTMIQRNETKFVNLGFLLLAVPAGIGAARHARSAALLLALAVPTNAVAYAGFALDRGQDNLGRLVPGPELQDAYAWAARHTATRDVFLEAQEPGATDPVRDLLVHGPRALVWGGEGYAWNWGYERSDLLRRHRAAGELAQGALSDSSYAYLADRFVARGRAVYAVRRGAYGALPGGGAWSRVYEGRGIAFDRLGDAREVRKP